MERVSTIRGKSPVLLIAPHGFDDKYTDTLTEAAAKQCGAYAVINRGWERAKAVDDVNSKANCNNLDHVYEDVVMDEFLMPILKYHDEIIASNGFMHYFVVHGCGNDARIGNNPNLSVVIGYGEGPKPSLTCPMDMLYGFDKIIKKDGLWHAQYAASGSKFSGWDWKNLNQLWRKADPDPDVTGFQMEFVTALRKTRADAETSGNYLGSLLTKFLGTTWAGTPATPLEFHS